jgi:transcriptional regulator with XRE-family HTH domain
LYSLGDRLKHVRLQKKLTQGNVSAATGVSTSNISRIEKNEISPSADIILHICKYLGISINWLLTGEEEPTTQTVVTVISDLSDTEEILLEEYRAADKDKRRAILQAALNTTADKTALGRTNDVPE